MSTHLSRQSLKGIPPCLETKEFHLQLSHLICYIFPETFRGSYRSPGSAALIEHGS
jgi:hypothetical protein